MSDDQEKNYSDSENLCILCFKNVEIYSIGICDHPVCYECSTRMRVLCLQNECPICRGHMPKVIFTKHVEPFSTLYPKYQRTNLHDPKFGFLFCSFEIQKAYQKLLEHRCNICDKPDKRCCFKTFALLRDHMRREHELFYCDICVENVKIFSTERRCYTRQELGTHRRKGDPDNTSHRGHPLCEFCDMRFMDSDELFRHLRRNHFFCHLCDADGRHLYYKSIEDLQKHFRVEHYLCEEGECKYVPMTAAFRTEIDLKAHIHAEHGKFMSKTANKQARTLELQFTLAPRNRPDGNRNRKPPITNRNEVEGAVGYDEPGGPGGGHDRMFVNPLTVLDFPALGNNSGGNVQNRPLGAVNFTSKVNKFSNADFPTLGGSSTSTAPLFTISANSSNNRPSEVSITRKPSDFPALGKASPSSSRESTLHLSLKSNPDPKSSKVSIQVNHKPNGSIHTQIRASSANNQPTQQTQFKSINAFPALVSNTPANFTPQWVQVKAKKKPEKQSKVAPTPQLPPTDLSEFPDLAKKSEKKAKKLQNTMPTNNWVNLNSLNTNRNANASNNDNNQNGVKKPEEPVQLGEDGKNKKKKKGKVNNTNNNNINISALEREIEQEHKTEGISFNNILNKQTNGVVKKRSEIKIDPLPVRNSPPEVPKPPPGFTTKVPAKTAPPPGFQTSSFEQFPSLGYSNDLTFTTSSGQSYSIIPKKNNYRQPSNFTTRNQSIIKKLTMVSGEDAIWQFKNYSDLFRSNNISAETYYEHCKKALSNNFDEFFPELLVLLPDIGKQQELYKVHSGKSKKNLVVCENCQQIILKKELAEHYSYHALDSQFSSLGLASEADNIWKK